MSSKLIKNGSLIVPVDDEVVGVIRILKSGNIQCECPNLHPAILIKNLHNLITDIQYASFQPAEVARIVPPSNVV
jgi:hypothetical protein